MSPFCVGTISGQGAQGALTASLAAYSGANPDNTDILAVDLSESAGVLQPVPAGSAAQGLSLCYVDGELLAYQNEALTTANVFKFTLPTNTSLIGQTVYFKFQSFNIYGSATQDISTCTAFPHTVTGLG